MKRIKPALSLSLAVLLAHSSLAQATEAGRVAYPDGAENYYAGFLPPPGDYFINYVNYYSASKLMDGRGNVVPIDFQLTSFSEVVRWVHVTPARVLGGNLGAHVIVPLVDLNISSSVFKDSRTRSLGNVVTSVFVGWHSGSWHTVADVDLTWPTGSYEQHRIANVGTNSLMLTSTLATSYLTPDWHVGLKFMYDVNRRNKATDYKSGDALHVDWLFARQLTKSVSLGLSGFVFQQLRNDEVAGLALADSKSRAYAVGPAVSYQKGDLNLQLHYQREYKVLNRPQGAQVWLKAIVPL